MTSQKRNLLLVEDEDNHAELIEYYLSRQKYFRYTLTRAQSFAQAEEALRSSQPDLVLLDLSLADSDIEATLARLPKLATERPVIVLTSLDDPATGERAVQNGAEDFLAKTDLSERRLADAIRYGMDRHELKRKLREAHARAEQSAAAKSNFLATMSHEIRTPMNAVIGFTNLLLDGPLSEEQRRYVSTIANSGEALLVIINDILDFSKIESGKLPIEDVSFNLHEALSDVVELLEPRARAKAISLRAELSPHLDRYLMGDPSRIRQVLVNLVGNAIKFTESGSVRLLARSVEGEEQYIELQVTDTGTGISESQLERIFDKFTQADASTARRYGGTGLGLTITKQLVELMQGRIWVESLLGHGSTFTIRLPRRPAHALEDSSCDDELDSTAAVQRTRGLRVLVADDLPTNQLLARRFLEKLGCFVDVAASGVEVVQLLEQLEYDLILMDCHMPEMDGYEATRLIRKRESTAQSRRTPIIALTAGAMAEDRSASQEAGMDDHLTKPIRPEQLRSTLLRWVGSGRSTSGRAFSLGPADP